MAVSFLKNFLKEKITRGLQGPHFSSSAYSSAVPVTSVLNSPLILTKLIDRNDV